MDFIINRIENIEYSLADIENFVEEVKKSDGDTLRAAENHSVDRKINKIKNSLKTIKKRVKNDQILEKSDYLKLKQMKHQYQDLANYLSKNREMNSCK